MKKLLCLLLSALMLLGTLGVVGCQNTGSDEDTTPSVTDPGTESGTDAETDTSSVGSDSETEVQGPSTEPAPVSLYDLLCEDMRDPIGVDALNPTFSWKMSSDVLGQKQTAYQIIVKSPDGATVWDSGKVATDDSVDIPYAGNALSASTRYTWDLTVWDKDDKGYAAYASFETGIFGKEGFAGASWISCGDAYLSDVAEYTIDFEYILTKNNFGVCFNIVNDGNMYMWQINTQESGGSKVHLRPHVRKNGVWTAFGGNIDITEALGFTKGSEMLGKAMHMRLTVDGQTVITEIAPVGTALKEVNRYDLSGALNLYSFGFRLAGTAGESVKIDNIIVADMAGNTIYENDFSSAEAGLFRTTGGSSAIQGGKLTFSPNSSGESLSCPQLGSGGLPAFRKTFTLKGKPASAKLYTSGLGVYESYINGERVGRLLADGTIEYHELKPGASEVADRKYYSSYDVTHMLTEGSEQVIAAEMASGWWSGEISGNGGAAEAYLAKLILTYEDGTTEVIVTDTTWMTSRASSVTYADIYGGEDYDARIDRSWINPGYQTDDAWSPATINTAFNGDITAWMGSYITVRKDLERDVESVVVYKGATGASGAKYGVINVLAEYKDGSFTLNPGETALVDFGQNFAGWEAFTVQGEAGTVLTIEHGEMLNDREGERNRANDGPGGSLYNANNRSARAATVYTLRGGEAESYHPSMTYYGFRYIEIKTTKTVTFTAISGQVVTSVEEDTGFMETSHEDINKLISNIRWGQYSNYLSVPTDCPQRNERLGWMADTQVFATAGCYIGFSKSFLEKYMQDVRDTQAANGAYHGVAPGMFVNGEGQGGTGWADAGIIVPYILYTMYDDVQVIRDNWDSMQKYVDDYLGRTSSRGPNNIWGDWLAYESNDQQIQSMLAVAYYAWDALMMADMAEAIGLPEEATRYKELYERERTYFIRQYVNKDTGALKRGEQSVCLYALYLDLLPDEASVAVVTEQLVSNITSKGNRLQTGFLGTKIILDTLTKIGRNDLAYSLLLQTDNPSWLYSVLQGATTIWERWNSYTIETGFGDVNMNSFNHYAYGAVAAWMFDSMAGIGTHPDAPGFKRLLMTPHADTRIGTVKASYESAYGLISVESVCDDAKWTYTFTIPANTTAELQIPVDVYSGSLMVGDKAADTLTEADGIVLVGIENGIATFEVVAGTFTVVAAK